MKTENWYLKNEMGYIPATAENIISFIQGSEKPQTPKTDNENRQTEARYLKMGIVVRCYYENERNVTEFI